jgi:xylan 1,4-beta-xylosidase
LDGSGTELLEVDGSHSTVDAWVIRKSNAATILMTNLALRQHPTQAELVNLKLSGAPAPRTAWIERIDQVHANPPLLWETMGEPEYLSPLQVEQLEMASTLRKGPHPCTHDQGNIDLAVALPPQSVAAFTIEIE